MTKLLGIVGASGSGKTTLIERLLPLLRAGGLRVATIKHAHHPIDPDAPGKDSWRHRRAGAVASLLVGPNAMQFVGDAPRSADARALARWLFPGVDLVLVEGWSATAEARIAVLRDGERRAEAWQGVMAVATDDPSLQADVPVLDLNDSVAVAGFVLAWLAGGQVSSNAMNDAGDMTRASGGGSSSSRRSPVTSVADACVASKSHKC